MLKNHSDRIKILDKTLSLLGNKKALFFRLLFFKALDLFLLLITPLFYYIFINDVIAGGKIRDLPLVIMGYLAIFVLQTLLVKCTKQSYHTLFYKFKLELKTAILKKYVNMKTVAYEKYSTGDLHNRIDRDVHLFETFLQKHVIDYSFAVVGIVILSVILFVMNPFLTVIGFIAIPLSFWFAQVISKKTNRISEEKRKFEGEYENFLNHSFQNWVDIKSNNLEECMAREFDKYRKILSKLIVRHQVYNALNRLFMAFKDYFITRMNLYFVGGLLIIYEKMTVGILLAYMDYFIQLVNNISIAVNSMIDFSSQKPNLERVYEILDLEYNRKKQVMELGDEIIFSKLSFQYYEKQTPVLDALDLKINPGEHIALVGKSGCGKTTLIHLLMGMYEPCSGDIWIGGQPVSQLSQESISRKIGIVTQFSHMMNLSIRENLLLANRHASEDEIREACKKANILSFIDSLPQKLDTNIGERGVKLSGGQKQRLAIARILLQNPDIIIFDESTSSLDSLNENEILRTIRGLSEHKTIITIAHRLSTVQICDRVALIDGGKVTAIETPSDMFYKNSKFTNLFKPQYTTTN